MKVHEPISVEIIPTGRGTTPEPGLEQDWLDLDKLRWRAGVLRARTGITVRITTETVTLNGRPISGIYGYLVKGSSGGGGSFDVTWAYLNGMEAGLLLVGDGS